MIKKKYWSEKNQKNQITYTNKIKMRFLQWIIIMKTHMF